MSHPVARRLAKVEALLARAALWGPEPVQDAPRGAAAPRPTQQPTLTPTPPVAPHTARDEDPS